MINPRQLASLLAISRHGSFSAAARSIGRSHSAVSLHVKALEQDLNLTLVDRGARPVTLTPDGAQLAQQARRLQGVLDDIAAIGQTDTIEGTLVVGIVPTAMAHLVPPALADLRAQHPGLGIEIRTGLSGELAQSVRTGDLDAALLTAPDLAPDDLELRPVLNEPLCVIAPASVAETSDTALLAAHPFIWFSRKTWAGQQIERKLLERRIRVRAPMEVDSLEAIEQLVRHGLGVAVVPQTGPVRGGLIAVPFGRPQAMRQLALMTRPAPARARLIDALHGALDRASQTNAARNAGPG